MKPFLPLCLLVVSSAFTAASGQAPAAPSRPHSLSVTVETVSAGGTVQSKAAAAKSSSSSRYSSSKTNVTETTKSSESIAIKIHNFGTMADTAQVEWYFVAEPAHLEPGQPASAQLFIFDKGSQNVNLNANAETTIPVASQEISSSVQRKSSSHSRYSRSSSTADNAAGPKESGDKLSGWIVRVIADGKVLDAQGSKQGLEELAKDTAKLAAMSKK